MAELLIRASSQDGALLRRIYGIDGISAASARPDRIVVDAHTLAMQTDRVSPLRWWGLRTGAELNRHVRGSRRPPKLPRDSRRPMAFARSTIKPTLSAMPTRMP